ncbi:MAG: hypothetical protein R6X19_03055 [Kiritimatiellia bacterium]
MTQTKLYLHIGHPKTGTTSIQKYLVEQESRLRKAGYLFPVAGRSNGVHFGLFPVTFSHQGQEDGTAAAWTAFRGEVARSRPKAVVVSCETAFAENTDWLREAFAGFAVTILYYIRRQDLWIPSFYDQRTKYAHLPEFRPLCGMAEAWIPPYLQTIRRFVQAFGGEKVRVRPFENNAWLNGDLIQDFLSQIGLDPAAFPPAAPPRNEGLKPDYRRFLLACNQLPLLRREARALIAAVKAQSLKDTAADRVPVLDDEIRRRLLGLCAGENERIARECLGRADGVLFRDPFRNNSGVSVELEPLAPERQHALFDRLSAPVRETLSAWSPRIRMRRLGEAFLPELCPDDPAAAHRILCNREFGKIARQLAALENRALDLESLPGGEPVSEIVFFETFRIRLSRLQKALLARLVPHRPELAVPELPVGPRMLAPDCAAMARACLLVPLWEAERLALLEELTRLSAEEPSHVPREEVAEDRSPTPPGDPPPPTPARQAALFERLGPAVRRMLTFQSPSIRERMPGELFWPVIPSDAILWRRGLLERDLRVARRYAVALAGLSASADHGP